VEKVALFCNSASGGTFSSTAIEKFAVAHIMRPGSG
jgi:hypothetical protein